MRQKYWWQLPTKQNSEEDDFRDEQVWTGSSTRMARAALESCLQRWLPLQTPTRCLFINILTPFPLFLNLFIIIIHRLPKEGHADASKHPVLLMSSTGVIKRDMWLCSGQSCFAILNKKRSEILMSTRRIRRRREERQKQTSWSSGAELPSCFLMESGGKAVCELIPHSLLYLCVRVCVCVCVCVDYIKKASVTRDEEEHEEEGWEGNERRIRRKAEKFVFTSFLCRRNLIGCGIDRQEMKIRQSVRKKNVPNTGNDDKDGGGGVAVTVGMVGLLVVVVMIFSERHFIKGRRGREGKKKKKAGQSTGKTQSAQQKKCFLIDSKRMMTNRQTHARAH